MRRYNAYMCAMLSSIPTAQQCKRDCLQHKPIVVCNRAMFHLFLQHCSFKHVNHSHRRYFKLGEMCLFCLKYPDYRLKLNICLHQIYDLTRSNLHGSGIRTDYCTPSEKIAYIHHLLYFSLHLSYLLHKLLC